MKGKALTTATIAAATLLMTTATFAKPAVRKTTARHDGKNVQIQATIKGSADGVIVEAFTSKKATKKSKVFSISSKPKKRTVNTYNDGKLADVYGTADGYEVWSSYERFGTWRGESYGVWSKAKGIKDASMESSFNNSTSKIVVNVTLAKKLKNGKKLYVRVTPLNGKKKGKKGSVVMASKNSLSSALAIRQREMELALNLATIKELELLYDAPK